MSLHNNNIAPERQALPVTRSSRARRFFRSALGVALMVMATLCSTFDAEALMGHRTIKYGTLSFSIPGMDNSYTPGKRYTLNATFVANANVFGQSGWNGFLRVSAGGQTLGRQSVKVYKSKTSSVSVSFTAPTDGRPLKISFGHGSEVYGSITIPAKKLKNLPDEPNPDSNTGDNGNTTGADDQNPGDQNSGADDQNPGDQNSGDQDSGDQNSGDQDPGDQDPGAENPGDQDPGDENPGDENPGDETQPADDNNPLDDLLSGIKDNDLVNAVQKWFEQDPLGLEQTATPDEAATIGTVSTIVAALLGGGAGGALGGLGGGLGGLGGLGGGAAGGVGGGVGGGAAGGSVPPLEGGAGGPPPLDDPFRVNDWEDSPRTDEDSDNYSDGGDDDDTDPDSDNYEDTDGDNYEDTDSDNYEDSDSDNYEDTDSDNYEDSDSDNDEDSDSDNYEDSDSDNDEDSDSDNDEDTDSDNDEDSDSDNDEDSDSDNDEDTDSDNDEDSDSDNDEDTDSDNDEDTDSDNYDDSDSDNDEDSDNDNYEDTDNDNYEDSDNDNYEYSDNDNYEDSDNDNDEDSEGDTEGDTGGENVFKDVEDKYVTRDPDGSITIKDPITGEEKFYRPDGQGGYDNPLGGGFKSEEDMLEHLAMLDRNRDPLSQDAATAARNQAEQHAQWEAQNARDLERGYSDEQAAFKQWREEEERKTEQIIKLADKYYTAADEESVRRAIKQEQIKAGIESAKQEAIAADHNVTVVGLESTKNVAATSLVLIPMAVSGVGTVSAATMAKAKLVQSAYTMTTSITDKVGDAYVKGENMATAAVHGAVTGAVDVAKNYAGDIGGAAAGKLTGNASKLLKGTVNLGTEAAVVIGGEGFKQGLEDYAEKGDLNSALDAAKKGIVSETGKHLTNKLASYGLDKGKEFVKSRLPNAVGPTRARADAAAQRVESGKSAVTRTQNDLTSAQQRVTTAQQRATQSRQQVTTARGNLNNANERMNAANRQVDAARQNLNKVTSGKGSPAEVNRAQDELRTAQQNAAKAQQNVNQARANLQTAQRVDTATQRVAQQAENNLQKAQWSAQKAQSDLRTATDQHNQALRAAHAAEQQAQLNKFNESKMAGFGGSETVDTFRALEDFNEKIGKVGKENT